MGVPLRAIKDVNGVPVQCDATPAPTYVNAIALGAATNKTVSIPSWATHALISVTSAAAATYFKCNGAASTPSDTTDGTASINLPPNYLWLISLEGVTSLNFINAGTPIVTVAFFNNKSL